MSFGYGIGDAILLTQLAWKTVQQARKACGEHDELTREVLCLHVVLRRLEQEAEKPGSPINDEESGGTFKEELTVIVDGCKRVLNALDQGLTKYNALSEQGRSGRKLWQKIEFGNGKMEGLGGLRGKLTYYTSAMSLFLNMVSTGTMGRVERQMNDAGGYLKEIKVAVNGITAHLMSRSNCSDGSIHTAYTDDDGAVWKELRRELRQDGFSSSVIRKHKGLIKAYIEELGSRGLLDEEDPDDDAEGQYCGVGSAVEGAVTHETETKSSSGASLRPKAEVELPVASKPPQEFDTKPNAALHLHTESGDREGPCGKSAQSPAEETTASKTENEPKTATTSRDNDRRNHPGREPRYPPYSIARSNYETTMPTSEGQSRTLVMEKRLSQHYASLKMFLAPSLRDEKGNPRPPTKREKLLQLSLIQFHELSTDVYDELLRRQSSAEQQTSGSDHIPPHLLPKDNSHPKRNQNRQRFATLPPPRYQDLATDVFYELERRFPMFAANSISGVGSPSYEHERLCDELEAKESLARDYLQSLRFSSLGSEIRATDEKVVCVKPRNECDEIAFKESLARDFVSRRDAVPSRPRRSRVAYAIDARTPPPSP